MKIEVGKKYKIRAGNVVECVLHRKGNNITYPFIMQFSDDDYFSVTPSGKHHATVLVNDFDIIAEHIEPDAEGWIEWHGGECPVPAETVVECKIRISGNIIKDLAGRISWYKIFEGDSSVTAYRIFKEIPQAKSNSFFLVWKPSGANPVKRHNTLANAEHEAKRLLSENRGAEFYVLEAKLVIKQGEPVVEAL